jgi:putative membrane protein insertion efficiency factor
MMKGMRGLPRRLGVVLLSAPVHLYRCTLSPLLPPSCRFSPSCSAYALEALSVHGPLKGSWLALRRLSRCHPITILGGGSGHDPVPERLPHR